MYSSRFFYFGPGTNVSVGCFGCMLSSCVVRSRVSRLIDKTEVPELGRRSFGGIIVPVPPLNVRGRVTSRVSGQGRIVGSGGVVTGGVIASTLRGFRRAVFRWL